MYSFLSHCMESRERGLCGTKDPIESIEILLGNIFALQLFFFLSLLNAFFYFRLFSQGTFVEFMDDVKAKNIGLEYILTGSIHFHFLNNASCILRQNAMRNTVLGTRPHRVPKQSKSIQKLISQKINRLNHSFKLWDHP